MKPVELDSLKNWFAGYTAGYLTKNADHDRAIRLKIDHTQRVCQNIIMLARAMNLSENDLLLAETMGLFHDIGRFEQYAVYGTFSDMASENHARMGMRQIAKHKLLAIFTLPEKRLIAGAVAFHNAATLPHGKSHRQLFFMKLLRDADKLDIWKVVTDYYHGSSGRRNATIEMGLPDEPRCSGQALDALHQGRIIRLQNLKTLNDFKLLQRSWAFDLNFVPSFQAL
ncbi:MAG: HD domain-containing protein, partial [Deltaproteobacteria bacterium]|nr:HD domain-containing protein [Deltaproteobacteria bacterium]